MAIVKGNLLHGRSRNTKLESFRQALQTLWTEDEIELLRKRLDGYQQHLFINILVLLKLVYCFRRHVDCF
jgi:hypothetical protein